MTARGRLFKRGVWWRAEIRDSTGKIVITDECSNYQNLADQTRTDVEAVRIIESAGHRLQFSYAQIVDAHPNYPKETP